MEADKKVKIKSKSMFQRRLNPSDITAPQMIEEDGSILFIQVLFLIDLKFSYLFILFPMILVTRCFAHHQSFCKRTSHG